MNNTYYAPTPWKQNDGRFRATDTHGNEAFGDTPDEAKQKPKK